MSVGEIPFDDIDDGIQALVDPPAALLHAPALLLELLALLLDLFSLLLDYAGQARHHIDDLTDLGVVPGEALRQEIELSFYAFESLLG